MMNSKKKLANTLEQQSGSEFGTHQLQQQVQHSQMQQQQHQQQQQYILQQTNADQLSQVQHPQQNLLRQGLKSNSLSMSAIVTSNNIPSNGHINQLQNSIYTQNIPSPSNANNVLSQSGTNQQKSSPQKIQQLNNKAFSLIKNSYFKPNSAMSQTTLNLQYPLQQPIISSPTGQTLLSPNQQSYQYQHQHYQQQSNNSGNSAINLVSNKKSPKISNHSQNKVNNSSGMSSLHNQKDNNNNNNNNNIGYKDVDNNNNEARNSEIVSGNQHTHQKSSNQFPQSIDKTTHLQNLDKIRNNLNNKLQIQTELNANLVGGNSSTNIGQISNQAANMSSHHPPPPIQTMNGNSSNHYLQNQNQTFKKIISITPQYSNNSKIKLFESQNKQLNNQKYKKEETINNLSQQPLQNSLQQQPLQNPLNAPKQHLNKIDVDEEEENQNNNYEQNFEDDDIHNNGQNIHEQEGNSENNNVCGQKSAINEYSKNGNHKQSDLTNLNLAATVMFDKLKKRDKNPNSAKGHPRNAHQSGFTSNASYSKSSLPSNNSTTVNHYQGSYSNNNNNINNNNNNNNINQNQSMNKNMQLAISQTLHQPAQLISPVSNMQSTPFLSNINNMQNKNIFGSSTSNMSNVGSGVSSNHQQQNGKNQLSKTLSFTIQQYHQLMNHDLHQMQSQQQTQQNIMKQIHSQIPNQQIEGNLSNPNPIVSINIPQLSTTNPLVSQQNTNLTSMKTPFQQPHLQLPTTQKHRKVVSMSSSSPKYSKENMYIDCSKGSYNIVDVKKLFKGANSSTNFHLLSNNLGNFNKALKNISSIEKGEVNFCTPHSNQNQSTQHGSENRNAHLQIKFSKTPGNMSFNHSTSQNNNNNININNNNNVNNNHNNNNNNENNREQEKFNCKNQEKSKNFLSKITNHQGKNSTEENNSKKRQQKKSHKSQSCIAVSSQVNNQKNFINQQYVVIDQKKDGSQAMVSQQIENIQKNRNMYQSQTDFSLLKQQLMAQQPLLNQINDNQIQQQHISYDDTTAVNSNAKEIKQPNQDNLLSHNCTNSPDQFFKAENARITTKFDQILKQRIDENSYSHIMDVFAQLINSDVYFQSSLRKFKICLDSLMHDMNGKIKNLKVFAAKTQQLKKSVETINNEKKQLQNKVNNLQNENQQLLSNSTNVTNSNQSKTNNNINMPSDSCNNNNFPKPNNYPSTSQGENLNDFNSNVNQCQELEVTNQYKKSSTKQYLAEQNDATHFEEKYTQTALKESESTDLIKQKVQNQQIGKDSQQNTKDNLQIAKENQLISREEIDETTNENVILRGYVVEQEKKLTAYKEKESSMIKLLLAIKKNGIDIDEIYEREVINQVSHHKHKHQNNNDDEDDDDQDDAEDIDFQGNLHLKSRFINNIQNGILDNRNRSQSLGYADESIINDSDESSFNYFGKTQSFNDSLLSQIDSQNIEQLNMNNGRLKIEDGLKKKLRLNLNDLKKVNTQQNEEVAQNNNNPIIQQQQKQQQQKQMNELNDPKETYNIIHNQPNQNKSSQNQQQQQFMNGSQNGMYNQNIFIEQEYQERNFDSGNKNIVNPQDQLIENNNNNDNNNNNQDEDETNFDNQNEEYFQSGNLNILQGYNFNSQMKESQNNYNEMNEYISQSDYQTHKVDSQTQNHFEIENDQIQDEIENDNSVLINQNQIDSQNELMKKLDEISLTWPDDSKQVLF